MSDNLYKLGKWAFIHRWRVLISWLVVLGTLGFVSVNYSKPLDTAISIPGTAAQETLDKLSKELPAASNASGSIVFATNNELTVASVKTAIDEVAAEVSSVKGVSGSVSPFVSKTISQDGKIALMNVQLSDASANVPDSVKNRIEEIVEKNRSSDLQIEMRGSILPTAEKPAPIGEVAGIAVAAVVLAMTFFSLVAAGMPLIIAFISVGLGMLTVNAASGFMTLPSTATALSTMLGLAVGIDYALFMIVKYIKFLKEGATPQEAVGRTTATAGNAVLFAALTVIIALAALTVVGIPFLAAMGVFAAITVGFAALAAVTIVPALLGFAQYKVLRKSERAIIDSKVIVDANRVSHKSASYKWVTLITKKPLITILIAVISLGALALPATKLYLGLPGDNTAATTSTERKAYDLLSKGFGAGFNGPLIAVIDLPDDLNQIQIQTRLGETITKLQKEDGVKLVAPGGVSEDGRTAIVTIIPTTGPNDQKTRDLISRIRDDASSIVKNDSNLSLTGATAIAVDVNAKLANALPLYLAVVVGLSLIILITVFRSIVVPIKATLGFLLTITSTLGFMVIFFQWGWLDLVEGGPILSFLPILATGILFGLAMDYQFFLVSGIQEEYHKTKNAKDAVVKGFSHGAKVVTVAAIIMISVFSGFIFTDDPIIKSIGFALAVGVLIDAFIVRMTIVPAGMALFGKSAWWIPKWLDKILPNISIEGSTEKELEEHEDLDSMRRAALLLSFGKDISKIQKIVHIDKPVAKELSPTLDNILILIGLESKLTVKNLSKIETIPSKLAEDYLDELEKHRFVNYTSDDSNEAGHYLLTKKGQVMYEKIVKRKLKDMNKFFEPLNDDDIRSLAKIVRKIRVGNQ